MNKYLKFRAWDGKKFHEWGYLPVSLYIEGKVDGLVFVSPPAPHYPSQQFAGLPDRTGKEICEGDLYITGIRKVIRQVYYRNGAFCGGMSLNEATPLNWEYSEAEDNLVIDNFVADIKIIGNIFENPELIGD